MNYKETLEILIKMKSKIMNEYGKCAYSMALEKAISLLQFITQNN